MQRLPQTLRFAILAVGVMAGGLPAIAADDTWVSATGTDAGACTIDAPCRSLNFALAQTSAGGSIAILSHGRFGPVTITKAVHITAAEGVEAVIAGVEACNAAVCINAGSDDVVSLRGLTIQVPGAQAGTSGISFLGGSGLHLDRCVIAGSPTLGIAFSPTAAAHLHVFDTQIRDVAIGVEFAAGSGPLRTVFDRAEVSNGNEGIIFEGLAGTGPIQATVRNAMIGGQANRGILMAGGSGSVPMSVMLDRSTIVNNGVGVANGGPSDSGPSGTIRIGNTIFSDNVGGAISATSGAATLSYGTNKVDFGPFAATTPLK